MKLEFDRTKMWWDDWKRFYNPLRYGYLFESGEVVVNVHQKDDSLRVPHVGNIRIVATTDHQCPALYIPGEDKPIPKAWLDDGGMQVLLVDYDTQRVVRLLGCPRGGENDGWRAHIPVAVRSRATAYFAGNGCPPQGAPVAVSPPRVLTRDEKALGQTNFEASKAWLALEADSPEVSALRRAGWREAQELAKPISLGSALRPFAQMTVAERYRLANRGFASERVRTLHDYLVVKETQA